MSVIEASSGTYRSRVDGTIVLSVEIEPRYRADALALFGMPGTPIALAALDFRPKVEKPKVEIGERCRRALDLAHSPRFWEWVAFATLQGEILTSEKEAAEYIKRICHVKSRKELDTDEDAYAIFNAKLFRPFDDWMRRPR